MTSDEFHALVSEKALEEYNRWTGRQSWEYNFIWSKWYDRLKWIVTPPGAAYPVFRKDPSEGP